MKIYISGKISGIPFSETLSKFSKAESLLNELGICAVNPIKDGYETSFEKHFVRCTLMIFGCDGILMLDGWRDSIASGIEYDIAIRTGKIVLFESEIEQKNEVINKIYSIVYEVSGVSKNELHIKNKAPKYVYARELFVHFCKNKIEMKDIEKYIQRDRSTIIHSMNKYDDDYRFDKKFRDMADKAEGLLNATKNEMLKYC